MPCNLLSPPVPVQGSFPSTQLQPQLSSPLPGPDSVISPATLRACLMSECPSHGAGQPVLMEWNSLLAERCGAADPVGGTQRASWRQQESEPETLGRKQGGRSVVHSHRSRWERKRCLSQALLNGIIIMPAPRHLEWHEGGLKTRVEFTMAKPQGRILFQLSFSPLGQFSPE